MSIRFPVAALRAVITFAVITFGAASPSLAQTDALGSQELKQRALARTSTTVSDGWKVALNFGGTVNFSYSNQTAAAAGAGEEGATFQVGIVVGLEGNYKSGRHRWRNKLMVQQTQTKQPERSFRKSLDNIELLSTYLYGLENLTWLGPFARFRLNTQLLRSSFFNDGGAVAWVRESVGADGTIASDRLNFEMVGSEQRVVQTEPFEPLLLRESVGFFASPFAGAGFVVDAKMGVGAQQVIARGGVTFVELRDVNGQVAVFREIENSNNVGGEGEIAVRGVIVPDRVTWRLTANVFVPFVASGDVIDDSGPTPVTDSPVGLEYANVDVVGGLSLKLAQWASLDYILTLRRVPLVVRGLQVQHGILLSAGFDLL